MLTFLSGSSIFVFITKYIYYNYKEITETFQIYLIGYFITSALISFTFIYSQVPVSNPRFLKIIEWILKLLSLVCIYMGISYKELFIALILGFSIVNLGFKINSTKFVEKLNFKFFPQKRRLLTQEEYNKQGQEFTLKALNDLKQFCQSPDCNSWKIVTRLKNPERFTSF